MYLGGRTQCVQVESKTSEYLECEDSGAPQGSILAGLFHLINSNDMPACHDEGQSVVYVDDGTDSVYMLVILTNLWRNFKEKSITRQAG